MVKVQTKSQKYIPKNPYIVFHHKYQQFTKSETATNIRTIKETPNHATCKNKYQIPTRKRKFPTKKKNSPHKNKIPH